MISHTLEFMAHTHEHVRNLFDSSFDNKFIFRFYIFTIAHSLTRAHIDKFSFVKVDAMSFSAKNH